ncbi:MAG: DUF1559 domain-containing protein [Thermoguttaceae bacterium]
MKHITKTLILFALTAFVTAPFAYAETEAERVAKQIAPLVSEDTFLVAHLNLDKVDLDKFDAAVLNEIKKSIEGVSIHFPEEEIKNAKEVAKGFLALAKSVYNVHDVYFIGTPVLVPNGIGFFAVPVRDSAAAEWIYKSLNISGEHKVVNEFLIIPFAMQNDAYWNTLVSHIDNLVAVPRPEILAALESVEGSALQVVLTPPDYARRVIAETMDTLPKPFEKFPPQLVTDGLKWAVLAADFEAVKLELIIKASNEQTAKDLSALADKAVDVMFEHFSKANYQYKELIDNLGFTEPEFVAVTKSMLPKPQGDRIVFTLNEEFVKENGRKILKSPAALVELTLTASRNSQCTNNLKQIMLAFHNYHDANGCFPPLYTVDKDGKPLHSWRVLILPYIEQIALYNEIKLDEPWDSEYNKRFHNLNIPIFSCPQIVANDPNILKNGLTTYSLIVGKNAYPEKGKYGISDITDGTSNTWGVVERKVPVNWMDPTHEVKQEDAEKGIEKSPEGIAAPHPGAKRKTNIAFFDGSVNNFRENLKPSIVRALITRNGGEAVSYYGLPEEIYDDEE